MLYQALACIAPTLVPPQHRLPCDPCRPTSPACPPRSALACCCYHLLQDVIYEYPDMSVCVYGGLGCDEIFMAEACARSSNATEGGSRNGTFIYDWFEQQSVSSSVEQSFDDGVSGGCCRVVE